jgi:hypothetical protein
MDAPILRKGRLAPRILRAAPKAGALTKLAHVPTHGPLGGVERPRRVVRFARLIQRPGRVLGGPTVRAAFGGNRILPWLLLKVAG